MTATLGCMREHLTRMVFVGVLGMALGGAALTVPPAAWADEVKSQIKTESGVSESPVPNVTYDESQPGADDPRVKEGFAAYQAGDFKKAYDIWLPLAKAGNAEAQFRVGRLYDYGEGITKNSKKALNWYEMAISQDHLSAIFNMAYTLYWEENSYDLEKYAVSLLIKGANMGDSMAQHHLGIALAVGEGISRNYVEAFKWMYIALMNGNQNATSTITKLESITSSETKAAGYHRMREWFENHPRSDKRLRSD